MNAASKHAPTPGPWLVERNERRFNVWGRRGELLVAECGPEENTFSEANARLIASAPDFYRAAMLRREYEATPTDRGGAAGPKGKARRTWLEAEAAAIAKAEGRP